MQTEGFDRFMTSENIVFQISTKSPIELLSVEEVFSFSEKGSWYVNSSNLKKDIKTGNLIFDLTWNSKTNPVPKKVSESIELIYGNKKLKKETHNIIKPKGVINIEGFLLNYEISKDSDGDDIKITFESKIGIIVQTLRLLSDDNKIIERSSWSYSGGSGHYSLSIIIGKEEAKQMKKVSITYYPGPYKTVKLPLELRLPLK